MQAEELFAERMRKVSVVLPTYNRAYCLGDAIESVLSQTHSELELIIVDNTSDDDTRLVVESFRDPRIKFMEIKNGGIIGVSRNRGINAATGEFIAFIDSDDPWLPKKLERSVEVLCSGYDIVYHDLYITNGLHKQRSKVTNVSRRLDRPVIHDLIQNGNGLNTSSVVVKTELVKAANGFTESRELVGIEDYDLWIRIASMTDMFGFIDSPLGYYTMDGNGTLNRQVVERSLVNIAKHHKELHMTICGGTPSWIHVALAKINLRTDPRIALKHALEASKRKGARPTIHLKAVGIAVLAAIKLASEKVKDNIRRRSF